MGKMKITVAEAAEIMGKSQEFIRAGLKHGTLPFGKALKMSSIWTFYISPKLFYEYTGYKVEEGEPKDKTGEPETMKKKITIKEAAEIMGVSPQFIRLELQRGELPIGTAVKTSSIYTYYISPKLFSEYTGYKFEEEDEDGV